MSQVLRSALLFLAVAGCGDSSVLDPDAVYEAVLRHELKEQIKGEKVYLAIEGKDPSPELLARLREQWPDLQAASTMPKGKGRRIHVEDLKQINRNSAEVRGGFSNGIDGRVSRYRVIRKDGEWVVEKAEVEAIS